MVKKMFCKHCNKNTDHLEDVETFIPKPDKLKNSTIWICKECWNIITENNEKSKHEMIP